jgi:Tol biopolymer transport system component
VHRGGQFTSRADGDDLVLTRLTDGREWRFDTGGEGVVVSHDGTRVAWARQMGRYVPGQAPPQLEHNVADLLTGESNVVAAPTGYALSSWTENGEWLMFRQGRDSDKAAVIRFDPGSGATEPLLDGARVRTGRLSLSGRWIAVMRTNEDAESDNGIYIVATNGGAEPRKIELFGGYRWAADDQLLVIPQVVNFQPMSLWRVDLGTGAASQLTDPRITPFRVAAGEWSVSPDGRKIAYRSADDDAIWAIVLE